MNTSSLQVAISMELITTRFIIDSFISSFHRCIFSIGAFTMSVVAVVSIAVIITTIIVLKVQNIYFSRDRFIAFGYMYVMRKLVSSEQAQVEDGKEFVRTLFL